MIYEQKLSTRLQERIDRRLRLYAFLRGIKLADAVNVALDQQLPSLDELADEMAQATSPAKNHRPGQQINSEETR